MTRPLHSLQESLAQGIAAYCALPTSDPQQLLPFPQGLGRQQVVARALALLDPSGPRLLVVDRVLLATWQKTLAEQGLAPHLASADEPLAPLAPTLITPALLVRLGQAGQRFEPLAMLVRAYGLGVKDGPSQRDALCRELSEQATRSWTVTGLAVSWERAQMASELGRLLAQAEPWTPPVAPPAPLFPAGPPSRWRLSPLGV